MFSGNHQISRRQLYRNYASALISLGALLPPLIMHRDNPGSIVLALLFLGIFFLGTASAPRPVDPVVKWLCYVNYWVLGTMLIRMTGLLVQHFLLTATSLWVILLWFCLFCYYNLYKGLECRLRVSEILFPFFILLFLLLSALMYGEVEFGRLLNLRFSLGRQEWRQGYELFCWLLAAGSLWHLKNQLADESGFPGTVFRLWLTGILAVGGFGLFSYCVYGDAGHTGLTFPVGSAMTLAHFPGNVIGRLDSLFVFGWVIGLFLLCSSLLAPLAEGEPATGKKWILFGLMILSFGAACLPECMEWGQELLYRVLTPVQLLILFLQWVRGSGGRKKAAAAGCVLLSLSLWGCSSQELEQQSLVTAIGVDVGEGETCALTFGFGTTDEEGEEPFETVSASLQEARETYWEYFQKNMDFNHLKNFYFSQEVIEQPYFLDLLQEIQTNAAYSRGTLVHVTEGAAGEQAKKKEQPGEGIPIHRVLNAWYNQESCEISVITADGRYKGYQTWP